MTDTSVTTESQILELIPKKVQKFVLCVVRCVIWCHLHNLKNVKNTHGGVLILASNFTKINTPPWVFFTFFILYKWYQIAQRTTNVLLETIKVSKQPGSFLGSYRWDNSIYFSAKKSNVAY